MRPEGVRVLRRECRHAWKHEPGSTAMYQLVRTLPNGTEKSHSPVSRVRDAAVAASHVLADNTSTSKADAQRFSMRLSQLPIGETATHGPTGYAFRIIEETNG